MSGSFRMYEVKRKEALNKSTLDPAGQTVYKNKAQVAVIFGAKMNVLLSFLYKRTRNVIQLKYISKNKKRKIQKLGWFNKSTNLFNLI